MNSRCELLLLLLIVGGCELSDSEHITGTTVGTDKVSRIDPVYLESFSTTESVSLEQAEKLAKQQGTAASGKDLGNIELSLDEVRKKALENNLGLKVDLLASEIARTYSDQERAKFEAVFYGSAGLTNNNYTDYEDTSYKLGINKPLATGGELSVEFPYSRTKYGSLNAGSTSSTSVSFYQSLLRGGWQKYNTGSIKVARINNIIADAGVKQSIINLVAQVDVFYWQLYSAVRSLEIRREQYDLALKQLNEVKKKVSAGAAAAMEIVRAESAVSGRLESVINAESLVAIRYRNLQRMVEPHQSPISDSIDIVPMTMPEPVKFEFDYDEMVKYAQENRMDILKMLNQIDIDKINLSMAQNESLPDIMLSTSYKMYGVGGNYSESYSDLSSSSSSSSLYTGLAFSVPLGNKSARAKVSRMKLKQQQHDIDLDELKQIVAYDVRNAVADIDSSWRRILAARQGVDAAVRNYKVEQSQFQLGQRVSTDVSYAASHLADSQISQINAFVDYEIAQIRLALATGTVLGQSSIYIGDEGRITSF